MATEDIERLLRDKVRELAASVNCAVCEDEKEAEQVPEPEPEQEVAPEPEAEPKAEVAEEEAEVEPEAEVAEEEAEVEAETQLEFDADLDTEEFDEEAEAEAEEFEEEAEAEPEPEDVKSPQPALGRRPNLIFTLNDRFRFRRELFSNSDSEMADAINTIGSMHSYDEAEEYFFTDLNWDPENPDVADFMEIIHNSFK
ncbi:MAG: hypothetical protein HUK14_01050 [Muribaculaceae bacterium]|nr:hypothetical protein [Muribaculaceae bacterium]